MHVQGSVGIYPISFGGGIYVILGSDWLFKNHAIIEYNTRKVLLIHEDLDDDNQILFQGNEVNHQCIISYVKATKYLREGCQGFLASMVDAQLDCKDLDPSSVWVVSEYLDAFQHELLGLPPAREMEFSMDLLSETTPISKAPYMMAPVEL